MPDQMSGLMPRFFANFMPVIALMWALDLFLVSRVLYREIWYITSFYKILPPLICLAAVILFLILPIRSVVNLCFSTDV